VKELASEEIEVLKAILTELQAIRKENRENTQKIHDAVKYYSGI
jgi:hypothetical protein